MQQPDSQDYFARRAEQERAAAADATDERAALMHRQMAERYDELARGAAQPRGPDPMPTDRGILPRDLQIFP